MRDQNDVQRSRKFHIRNLMAIRLAASAWRSSAEAESKNPASLLLLKMPQEIPLPGANLPAFLSWLRSEETANHFTRDRQIERKNKVSLLEARNDKCPAAGPSPNG